MMATLHCFARTALVLAATLFSDDGVLVGPPTSLFSFR